MANNSNHVKKKRKELESHVALALKVAKKSGADFAEISLAEDNGLSVSVRNGEIETLENHLDKGLSITVYKNQSKGSSSTSDFSEKAIRQAVKTAADIAKFTAKDDYSGLADYDDLAWDYPELSLYYPWDISAEEATDLAIECEAAALKTDKRIVNSEGASVSSHASFRAYGNSHGFVGSFPATSHSLSCAVIGKDNDAMQRDYWYTATRDSHLLENAKHVGKQAAKRTIARLNARKISTMKSPILFSPEMSAGLIGHFIGAIHGSSLYRNASFLVDSLGEKIFPDWMHIYEQPHIISGLGSAPFDSEGVTTRSRNIVEQGIVKSYVLDSYAARKLKLSSTGNAGGVHNLCVEPGKLDHSGMLKALDKGLLVTELMGQGINIVTGDYSRGAAGFWVENGKIQFPVEEITIAGNLKDMFSNIVAVGNDVDLRGNTRTGSILIEEMMIAGG